MSRIFIFLSFFFLNLSVQAIELDDFNFPIEGDFVAPQYKLGRFLIYDCGERHFVCADLESFDQCKLRRQKASNQQKKYLDCAPLKEFASLEECKQEHYRLIHSINNLSFCIKN